MAVLVLAGEEFVCHDTCPGWRLLELVNAHHSNDVAVLQASYTFLRAQMDDAEFDRVAAHAQATEVHVSEIIDALIPLLGGYMKRPTKRPAASSGGPPRTSATSRDVSSSPATDRRVVSLSPKVGRRRAL